jgi:hypothetical protein
MSINKISVPYARVHVVTVPPLKILHLETDLPYFPATPGFDADKHGEMMRAAAILCGPRCEYDRFEVHAPDKP